MTIKELREKNKLSQAKLAKAIGVSGSAIAAIEAGQMKVSAKIAESVKEVYGEVIELGVKAEAVKAAVKANKGLAGAAKKKAASVTAKAEKKQAPAKVVAKEPEKASAHKMSKSELVKIIAQQNNMTQKAAAAAVDSVLNTIVNTVAGDEPVTLPGFGKFSLKHMEERQGRNPATGEAMTIPAKNVPVFKAGKSFREKV